MKLKSSLVLSTFAVAILVSGAHMARAEDTVATDATATVSMSAPSETASGAKPTPAHKAVEKVKKETSKAKKKTHKTEKKAVKKVEKKKAEVKADAKANADKDTSSTSGQ